jgi:hypothetical protein
VPIHIELDESHELSLKRDVNISFLLVLLSPLLPLKLSKDLRVLVPVFGGDDGTYIGVRLYGGSVFRKKVVFPISALGASPSSFYYPLFNNLIDLMLIVDHEYNVIFTNSNVISYLGYDREELAGKSLRSILVEGFEKLGDGDSGQFKVVGFLTKSKDVRYFKLFEFSFNGSFCLFGRACFSAMEASNHPLGYYFDVLASLAYCLGDGVRSSSSRDFLSKSLSLLGNKLRVARFCLYEFDLPRKRARKTFSWERGKGLEELGEDVDGFNKMMLYRRPCVVSRAKLPACFSYSGEAGEFVVLCPVIVKDSSWGIFLYSLGSMELEKCENEVSFLDLVSNALGSVIYLQESFHRANILNHLSLYAMESYVKMNAGA